MPDDRYLIETSATDGYLLEDGSGVLLLEGAPAPATADHASACLATHGMIAA